MQYLLDLFAKQEPDLFLTDISSIAELIMGFLEWEPTGWRLTNNRSKCLSWRYCPGPVIKLNKMKPLKPVKHEQIRSFIHDVCGFYWLEKDSDSDEDPLQ